MSGETSKTGVRFYGFKNIFNIFHSLLIFSLILGLSEVADAACVGATLNFECGDIVTQNCTLNSSSTSTGTCFTIGADNIVIDGAGYSVTGDTSGYGIHIRQKKNVLIKNCNLHNFNKGVYIEGVPSGEVGSADNNVIQDSNISNNRVGVHIYACGCGGSHANYNLVERNNILNNTVYGVYLDWNSRYNKIQNNTLNNNGYGVYIEDTWCQYNKINSNIICSNSVDIYFNNGVGNSGSNNTCETTNNWNDFEADGCTYSCPKPDLFVASLKYTPKIPNHGNNVNITAAVRNAGDFSASNINVSLFIDNIYENSKIINYLINNSEKEINFTWIAEKCLHDITIKADPDNEVNEINESNNQLSVIILVCMKCDFDCDGDIDIVDFVIFARNYHRICGDPGFNPIADVNSDCKIDLLDFVSFTRMYGTITTCD